MNNLDKDYQALLQDILDNGVTKQDRTGTGTISVFGRQIRHNMKDGFPLLTTKKMAWKTMVTELLWFLRGDTNIKFLVDNDCHIWDGDAYKNYRWNVQEYEKLPNSNDVKSMKMILDSQGNSHPSSVPFNKEEFINKIKTDDEFAKKWGELGPIYGKQWRSWAKFNDKVYTKQIREVPKGGRFAETRNVNWVGGSEVAYIDQIANLINDLKTNPDSRRLMVNSWNVGEISEMVLPPCHYGFQVYTRELDLDERAKLHSHPEMFYNINGRFSVDDNIENSNYPSKDRIWLHEQFDKGGIPKRAISLMWNQRSVDTFLGLPFNIASYGLLLEIIAKAVNMVPDQLIGNLGDVHLYSNHVEQAKEQISREPYTLPKLVINDEFWNPDAGLIEQIEHIEISDFEIRDYQSHPTIKAPLSN
jgi:thymidylate synthase